MKQGLSWSGHMSKTSLSQPSGKAVLRNHNHTRSQECKAWRRKEGEEPSGTHIQGPRDSRSQCSDQARSEKYSLETEDQCKSAAFRPADGKVRVYSANLKPLMEVTLGTAKLSTACSAWTSSLARCFGTHTRLPPRGSYLTFNLTKEITEKKVLFLFSSSLDRFPQELKGKTKNLFSPNYWQI